MGAAQHYTSLGLRIGPALSRPQRWCVRETRTPEGKGKKGHTLKYQFHYSFVVTYWQAAQQLESSWMLQLMRLYALRTICWQSFSSSNCCAWRLMLMIACFTVRVWQMHLLTLWPWPLTFQTQTMSLVGTVGYHKVILYTKFEHTGIIRFWLMDLWCGKQTDKETNRQPKTFYPRRPT